MAPILFTVPGLDWEVHAYGFLLALALVVGWGLALRCAVAQGLPAQRLGTGYVLAAAAGLFAARAGFLLQHPDRYEGPAQLLALAPGGLAPYFGAAVGLTVAAVHAARIQVPPLRWFDCLAIPYMVGTALERVGAFLAGTAYGRYVDPSFPLAVRYPPGSPAYLDHRRHLDMLLPAGADASLPVHPAQLYGAVLGVCGVLVARLWWRRRRRPGDVFLGTAVYALAARAFVEEWFRADAQPPVLGPLGPGQVVAAVLIAALSAVLVVRRRGGGKLR